MRLVHVIILGKNFTVIFYVPIVPEQGTPCPVALSCFHLFHIGVHNIPQLLSAFIPKIAISIFLSFQVFLSVKDS